MTSGYTAELGEKDKHSNNDTPCTERCWVCIQLVVEVFGGWGNEVQEALSRVAKKRAIKTSRFWPEVLASMDCRLGITLMRQNARALLGRRSTVFGFIECVCLSSLNIMYASCILLYDYPLINYIITRVRGGAEAI